MNEIKKRSLQECLASRKDCSGKKIILPKEKIEEICKIMYLGSSFEKNLILVLPDGANYTGGIYCFNGKNQSLNLLTNEIKSKYSFELYPEIITNESEEINFDDLINTGIIWQLLSLKAEEIGLGVSQRAMPPKKCIKFLDNNLENVNQKYNILYSVAVRERTNPEIAEDSLEPLEIDIEGETILLDTPDYYKFKYIKDKDSDSEIYPSYYNKIVDVTINDAIYNAEKMKTNNSENNPLSQDLSISKPYSLRNISNILWACQGETDHSTHGNRDELSKNGYGRVHATGCAGYAVYPLIILKNSDFAPSGSYIYNPVGFSGLNRWIKTKIKDESKITYDHFLRKYSEEYYEKSIIEFSNISNFECIIILCIDRKKPCSGFMHQKMMSTKYWAEIEAGMSLAGLQLQTNALGFKWNKYIINNNKSLELHTSLELEKAEHVINECGKNLLNKPKNEKLSLKGTLSPIILFHYFNI